MITPKTIFGESSFFNLTGFFAAGAGVFTGADTDTAVFVMLMPVGTGAAAAMARCFSATCWLRA